MTKNTKRIGSNREKEAAEMFESLGFRTWRPIGVRRPFSKDICGAFDIIAWDDTDVYLIQVKSDNSDAAKARKKISALGIPDHVIQVVLMRRPKKKKVFMAWRLYCSGWQRLPDFTERKEE